MDNSLSPIHPGEVLLEDFIKLLGLSQYRLTHDLGAKPIRISQIVNGQGPFQLMQPCVWLAILTQVQQYGSGTKFAMTLKLHEAN